MPNSPTNCHLNPQNHQNSNSQKRNCDFCGESVAVIYCRADSAKLCLCCDREVHSTNQLFTKHTRFQLCDNCDSSPASIFCCTDQSVCVRIVIMNSIDNLGALQIMIGGLLKDFDAKSLILSEESDKVFDSFNGLYEENDGFSDLFVWDVPTMVNLDDLIVTTDRSHNFQAMVVPPLPKHKHEMLRQLRELGRSEASIQQDVNPLAGNYLVADGDDKDSGMKYMIRERDDHPAIGGDEASPYTWCNETGDSVSEIFVSSALSGSHNEEYGLYTDVHSGICGNGNLATNGNSLQYPISNLSQGLSQKASTRELCNADRGTAISRYKEKRELEGSRSISDMNQGRFKQKTGQESKAALLRLITV
ncbi:Zinc finger protein CONSTANS-LIKE 13 [Bienertia sinuspersici]